MLARVIRNRLKKQHRKEGKDALFLHKTKILRKNNKDRVN